MRRWSAALLSGLLIAVGAPAGARAAETAQSCTTVTDQGLTTGAVEGSISEPGEIDCLELDSASGAMINVLRPAGATGAAWTQWTLTNGTGEDLCRTNECRLTGPAPYRIELRAPTETAVGDYRLIVQRVDRMEGCTRVPISQIGAAKPVTTTFSPDRFAACYEVPAEDQSERDVFSVAPVDPANTQKIITLGRDADTGLTGGCGTSVYVSSAIESCAYPDGRTYTYTVIAAAADAEYRVTRRNLGRTTANCANITSTTIGGPGITGVIGAPDDIRCYRLTGVKATDSYLIGLQGYETTLRTGVGAADDVSRCAGARAAKCRVTGATDYIITLMPYRTAAGPTYPFRLDTWGLGSDGNPPAECPAVAAAPNFAALTGTLTADRTAVCVSTPISGSPRFDVQLTNTAGGSAVPDVYLLNTVSAPWGESPCPWADQTGGRTCATTVPGTATGLFLVSSPTVSGTYPYRVETICDGKPCVVPASPRVLRAPGITGSVRVGATVKATAGSWDPAPSSYSYQWTANGAAISGATGTAYTIPASLRGKRLGVTVTAKLAGHPDAKASAAAVTVGYGAAPKATAKPKVKGTVKAGRTVKATVGAWSPKPTSFRYEWRVNGKLVAVTSSLKIKKSWAGKRLTLTVIAKRTGHHDGRAVSTTHKIRK